MLLIFYLSQVKLMKATVLISDGEVNTMLEEQFVAPICEKGKNPCAGFTILQPDSANGQPLKFWGLHIS